MFNRTVFVVFIVCSLLFGLAIYFYLQNDDQGEIMGPLVPAAATPAPARADVAEIERKIEQVKAERNPPEIEKLEQLLTEFEEDPTRWDNLIAMGDIYRKGAFPRFLPNEELAARIFKIAAMCPNGQVAGMGQSKYIETHDDPLKSEDKKGDPLPQTYGLQLCDVAEKSIQTTPWHMFEKPKHIGKKEPAVEPVQNTMDFNFEELMWAVPSTQEHQIPTYRHDSQNVHDHGVSKVTKYNIDNLQKNIDITRLSDNQKIDEVRQAIVEHKELNPKTKEEALHVIDDLKDFDHSAFNISEKNSLKLVWEKINNSAHMKDNLVETLAKQLSSAIENGHIVCSSGKITRIMSTLDGVSNEVARPMWALREEIGNKAAKIREQMTQQYGDTPEAGRRMREEFARSVKDEYVNKLGMQEKIIEPLISEYELGF